MFMSAHEHVLQYPGRDPMLMYFDDWSSSLKPMACMNTGCPWAVWTLFKDDNITAAVERGPWWILCILLELRLLKVMVREELHDNQLHPYHYSWNMLLYAEDPLWCSFVNDCDTMWTDKACFMSEDLFSILTVTSGHGLILMISANMVIRFTSLLVFGL
jgi:hypothetical protein